MSGTFDGYHVWLGIPPSEQPPNHYRLLGLAVFESDLDVIDHAADRQMAHVRTFQAGKNGGVSQEILNQLATARLCLLNTEKKSAYDAQLRAQLAAVPKAVPVAPPVARATAPNAAQAEPSEKVVSKVRPRSEIAAPLSELAETLDDLSTDEFERAASAASASHVQLRPHQRRRFRLPDWMTSAGMGAAAGIVVVVVLVLYYLGRYVSLPEGWTQFILEGPSAASGDPLLPSDDVGAHGTESPLAPRQP